MGFVKCSREKMCTYVRGRECALSPMSRANLALPRGNGFGPAGCWTICASVVCTIAFIQNFVISRLDDGHAGFVYGVDADIVDVHSWNTALAAAED